MLKLNNNFKSKNGKVKPVRIYQKEGKTLVGKDLTISGWGTTSHGSPQSSHLLVSTVNVRRMKNGGPIAGKDEFLVLSDGNRDYGNACVGDSGGNTTSCALK